MTSSAPEDRAPWKSALRLLAGIAGAGALGYAAFLLGLFGSIVFTGCFMSCSDPDYVGGTLLLSGAALAAAGAVTAAVAGFAGRRAPLVRVFGISSAMFAALVVTFVAGG